jgi:small multidrug resistance family-3 protein
MHTILSGLTANKAGVFLLLVLAAVLEALGDSFFQSGLHRTVGPGRILPFLGGSLALVMYGLMVNLAPWNFGKLLGIYVVVFFIAAQAISWLRFSDVPGPRILLGGFFILVGGCIMSWGQL